VPELGFDPKHIEAVIFDVDGTLYRQDSLRRAMAMRLIRAHALRPLTGWRAMKVIGAYRRAQEKLREQPEDAAADLAEAQIRYACEQTGLDRGAVSTCVERWMDREPLPLLASRIQPGLVEFLDTCRSRHLRMGVLSDYPAHDKLVALGIADYFDVVVSAQSREVGVFKPHPRGLLVIAERLGVRPSACLYVGDRVGVDDAAARAAGMPYFIVSNASGYSTLSEAAAQPVLDPR
jgi:putative hydrolase of the HAD superfamily